MMDYKIPGDLLFTESHEWARLEGNVAVVGISDFAVEQMDKEIVNVELPDTGVETTQGESCGVIDSVKAAFDLNAPFSGTVSEVNESIMDKPELVVESPYNKGWMFKIKVSNPEEKEKLMTPDKYRSFLQSQ